MKKERVIILLILCFVLTSCVSIFSIPKEKEYAVFPTESTEYSISVNSIVVTKDTVSDVDLKSQIQNLTETMFLDLSNEKDFEETLYLELELKQRSYYKGINQKNSIFLTYSLINEDDITVYNSSYSLVCSDSIESSKVEYELLNHMNNKIRKYLKHCNNVKN